MKKTIVILFTLLFVLLCGCTANSGVQTTSSETSEQTESAFSVEDQSSETPSSIQNEDGSLYIALPDGTFSYAFYKLEVPDDEKTDIVVPAEFNGKPVTEIHSQAFYMLKKNLRSVQLPDTIRSIGREAFEGCELLSEINLPESLTTIESEAFRGCTSLKQIAIPGSWDGKSDLTFAESGLEQVTFSEGLKRIPYGSFIATNIREVTLPSSIREIEFQAFAGCKYLERITLNDGLETIDANVFKGNSSLREITIPSSVTNMTELAFDGDEALEHIYFEGNAPENYVDEKLYPGFIYEDGSKVEQEFPNRYVGSYTVHYHEGAKGFTSPEWFGYQTEIW